MVTQESRTTTNGKQMKRATLPCRNNNRSRQHGVTVFEKGTGVSTRISTLDWLLEEYHPWSIFQNFSGSNSSSDGGAFSNPAGTVQSVRGQFFDNSSEHDGGAIYNSKHIKGIFSDFIENSADLGGAIYNSGDIDEIEGAFIRNRSDSGHSSQDTSGGAIYNSGNITQINSCFIGNIVSAVHDNSLGGGAIYNSSKGIITGITGDFIGNSVIQEIHITLIG